MGRARPPKSITILLPSPSASSSKITLPHSATSVGFFNTASTSSSKVDSITTTADGDREGNTAEDSSSSSPSLEVLILAKELARQRGQYFDIGSFLTVSQRKEYNRRIYGIEEEEEEAMTTQPVETNPPTPITGQTEVTKGEQDSLVPSIAIAVEGAGSLGDDDFTGIGASADEAESLGAGLVNGVKRGISEVEGDPKASPTAPLPPISATSAVHSSEIANGSAQDTVTDLNPPDPSPSTSTSPVNVTLPVAVAPVEPRPGYETIASKRQKINNLNIHWTQRRKKLQELAKIEAEGLTELPLSPVERELLLPDLSATMMIVGGATPGKGKEVDRGSIQASVSYWCVCVIDTMPRRVDGTLWGRLLTLAFCAGTTSSSPLEKNEAHNGTSIPNHTTSTGRRQTTIPTWTNLLFPTKRHQQDLHARLRPMRMVRVNWDWTLVRHLP